MKRFITILTISCIPLVGLISQETILFTAENWTVYDGAFIEFEGENAFQGTALLNNHEFENGTIEWDMYTTGKRSYPGIFFRMNDQQDYENIYTRPHKTNGYHYDALQYTPAYHGISCWQLYHGEGYTKEVIIPSNQWIHYRVVVNGDQAKVFIGDMNAAALTIHHLELGLSKGAIVINGQTDGSAYFANFSVSDQIKCQFGQKLEKPLLPGLIMDWDVSESITNNLVDNENYPGVDYLSGLNWKSIKAGRSGVVNLSKHISSNPIQPAWVYAKTSIYADNDKSVWYSFGYSDYVTLFLNGEAIFHGVNAFTSRDPSYAGLLGYFDKVKLNLKQGNNELVLLVGEQFGGWGFSMRNAAKSQMAGGIQLRWRSDHQLSYPESVAYDQKRKLLYVSNYLAGKGEFISKLGLDGEIIDLEWVKGLNKPTGIFLLNDSLYVTERRAVAVIEVASGQIIRRIIIPEAIAPNDITITSDGSAIYVSDAQANCIHRYHQGSFTKWAKNISRPNAICLDQGRLLAGCMGDASLKSISLENVRVDQLLTFFPGTIIDGLQVLENGDILIGDFQGILYKYDREGSLHELINYSGSDLNFSDFTYIENIRTLVIPGLYSISLMTFLLDKSK